MSTPLMSVVMSVYNGYPYVVDAISSILQQTLTDFELIVVDDGSTDQTWPVLEQYAAQDKRIRLWRNTENMGVARSQNTAMALARGDYIARQDADDIATPERLLCQMTFLENNPAVGAVGCLVKVIDESGNPIQGHDWYSTNTQNLALQQELLVDSYLGIGYIMMRQECAKRTGSFDDSLIPVDDYDFVLRLAEITQLANVEKVLYYYRYRLSSISHIQFHRQLFRKAKTLERALLRRCGSQVPSQFRQRSAYFYIIAAFANLDVGDLPVAQLCAKHGLDLWAKQPNLDVLIFSLLEEYTSRRKFTEAIEYLKLAAQIVPKTNTMARSFNTIHARLHLREVFAGMNSNDADLINRHIWAGIRLDIRWLWNKGVLATLLKLAFKM